MGIQKALGLSQLRKGLIEIYRGALDDLGPFLSDRPMVKGTVYLLRRKCFKPSCRCARGERHETMVLTASICGKKRLWTITEDRLDEIRQRTEQYRQFRRARALFLKECARRQAEMLRLIDAIAKARTRQP